MNQAHPNGNRLVETRNASNLTYVYNPAGSNWLYQKGSETRSKTASGNTGLASAQTAAETTTYAYNALGQRMKKSNGIPPSPAGVHGGGAIKGARLDLFPRPL